MPGLFPEGGPVLLGPAAPPPASATVRLLRTIRIGKAYHGPGSIFQVTEAKADAWALDGTAERVKPVDVAPAPSNSGPSSSGPSKSGGRGRKAKAAAE